MAAIAESGRALHPQFANIADDEGE